jgi:hypothetical protein
MPAAARKIDNLKMFTAFGTQGSQVSNPAHLILTRTNKLSKNQPPRLGCFFRE